MTYKRTAILIGGPADGRRVAIHDNHHTLYTCNPPRLRATGIQAAEQVHGSHVTRHGYRTFMSQKDVYLMCYEGLTDVQALALLIERYPPEVQ